VPGLEVIDFGSADGEQDAQNFDAAYSLRQARIQAGATLLNSGEVKSSSVDDRLKEVGVVGINIRSRNRWMLSHS
jgi:hypothetical protein